MIIVDTSVWINHFRRPDVTLERLLGDGRILLRPYVYGELTLGGLPTASRQADRLRSLASAPIVSSEEAIAFIKRGGLVGSGIGYVDAHLLASATLCGGQVLTADGSLHAQAERLGIAFTA